MMNTWLKIRKLVVLFPFLISLLVVSCGTLEINIEPTSTPSGTVAPTTVALATEDADPTAQETAEDCRVDDQGPDGSQRKDVKCTEVGQDTHRAGKRGQGTRVTMKDGRTYGVKTQPRIQPHQQKCRLYPRPPPDETRNSSLAVPTGLGRIDTFIVVRTGLGRTVT